MPEFWDSKSIESSAAGKPERGWPGRYPAVMGFTISGISELHASMHDCLDAVLNHAATMPAHLLAQEVTGFGRPTLRHQFAHILTTELAWVRCLQLRPIERVDPAALATVEEARQAQKRVAAATVAYLATIDETQLHFTPERYTDEWLGPLRSPAFTLLHVVTHAFHHKGQMVAMMRLLGYPAPDTDMQRG